MIRLTIHIGAGKTGSSAIQTFLRTNAAVLASDGVLVPPENMDPASPITGYHVWYFDEIRRSGMREFGSRLSASFERLVRHASVPVRQIILSAENLSYPAKWYELFATVEKKYRIEVVFYVRRQDEYLLSAWQQWYAKESSDFWAWLTRHVGTMGNWRVPIQEWENVVRPEDIIVRIYDRKRLRNGNVVDDFRNFVRTDLQLESAKSEINPSFNAGVLDLIAGNKALFDSIHDNGFYRVIEEMTSRSHALSNEQSTITFEQRLAILSRYDQHNAWIKQKYVTTEGVPPTLFDPPDRTQYRELSKEEIEKQKWNLVADLLYKLYKRDRRQD